MSTDSELSEILVSIDQLAERGRVKRSRAFAAWFAINFFYIDEDEALEAAAADGGNDQGIDIAFIDQNSEEIVVIQAHCPDNLDNKTPKAKWNALINSIPYLKDPSRLAQGGRLDLAESITMMKKDYPDYPISVGLVTLGKDSPEIRDSVSAHEAANDDEGLNYFYLPQEDISSRYRSIVSSGGGIPRDTLNFSGGHFEDSGDYGRAWIGSVSAEELQRLYKSHSDDLFAGNIRLFLGARKGGINEQIIKTAKERPGSFWALNNGVTIVADTAQPLNGPDSSTALTLTRFSIVNGCQTTSSLVQAKASSAAKVLVRVIAAKSTIKTDIVQYNNSQNAVKIWSVRSADDIQKNLRSQFKSVGINYAPKQEGSRRKKDNSIIELDKVTQYLAASQGEFLIQSIANKGELFDQPYQKLFHKSIQSSEVYLAWLIGSIADRERQMLLEKLGKDESSGLLGVTSAYWIIYCTYKLLEKYTPISSPHISLSKMKTSEFESALQKYVSKATDLFYDAAVDTYDRDEYGSFKSTLRSSKFLQRMDGKLNIRVARVQAKSLPNLVSVCKSAKVEKI